jgi:hypothetical protein
MSAKPTGGAREGAPGAVQVADRFHLLQNLAETLEAAFTAHAGDPRAVEQARRNATAIERGVVAIPSAEPQAKAKALAAGRREQRLAAHGRVWESHRQGWSGRAIAHHLGTRTGRRSRATSSRSLPVSRAQRHSRRKASRRRLIVAGRRSRASRCWR